MHADPRRFRFSLAAVLTGIALILATGPATSAPPLLPGPIPAEVLDVVDGDTITVRATIWLGQIVETNVRVDGMDAPEMRARCAREKDMAEAARDMARKLIGPNLVSLMDVQPDKYGGRVRARVVTTGGADLSDSLIKAGLARPYHGERRQSWCDGAVG
ncbi:thermonuclease family protein [Azospirillum canadense]|uniref:thermonuclease family protein n=1 Tax=Azospirillum canadense TaxID=403962 RepID=UPI0022272F61|nr:thermonuclease family protein [Azospirillum canadense]MCW2238054.1 endonuclease YncB(thermonuclease family) [Azospirillum canadense]